MAIQFLDIEDFQTRRLVVDGADTEITDTFWKNLHLKYLFILDSGSVIFATDALTELPSGNDVGAWVTTFNFLNYQFPMSVLSKPVMYTTESGKLVGYTLDFILSDPIGFAGVLNPDIDNDGNDFIKRLDGGEIADANAGLTWTVTTDDGVVLDPNKDEIKVGPRGTISENPVFPNPFLLLGVEDIA